jgi:hypothetical protein
MQGVQIMLWDILQQNKIYNLENQIDSLSHVARSNALEETANYHKRLNRRFNQLVLTNHAMWELLSERLNVSEKELLEKISEIDLRDGVHDKRYNPPPVDCPQCDAKIAREFNRCLFCGYEPEDSGTFTQIGI